MLRKLASCVLFSILLTSIMFAANTNPVRSQNTITVPDDYPTIQEAIDAATEGDTILVKNGTYYENVVVNKSVSLVGENKETSIIDGSNSGIVVHVAADDVLIAQLTLQHSSDVTAALGVTPASNGCCISDNILKDSRYGIWVEGGFINLTISGNLIFGNLDGIRLWSSGTRIVDNTIVNQSDVGIGFDNSDSNIVMNNTIARNLMHGMDTSGGTANLFYHNNFIEDNVIGGTGNLWNFSGEGNYWSNYAGVDANGDGIGDISYIIDTNNRDNYPLMHPYGSIRNLNTSLAYLTIQSAISATETLDGHTVFVKSGTYYEHVMVDKNLISLIGENPETTIIDGNYTGTPVTIMSNNVSITGFTIRGSGLYCSAISLGDYTNIVSGCNISSNSIANNYVGVSFANSGRRPAAWTHNSIFRNNVTGNIVGIELGVDFDLNTISGNRIVANNIGIDIESSNNTVSGNYIAENMEGIHFYHNEINGAWDNRIVENYILNNQYGLYVVGGMLSSIGCSEDSFLASEELSYSEEIYHNNFVLNTCHVYLQYYDYVLDNGCEGNYWSDYDGTDSDANGIGDTPYIIDGSNQDNYPLMNPYMLGDINHDSIIDIFDCARMGLAFSSTPTSPNWNPHCDVNEDGVIDIFDLVVVAVNFGETWVPP